VGRPPFEGNVPFDILLAHIQNPVPPIPAHLKVPPALEAAMLKALAKKPSDRFASAEEMSRALNDAISGGPAASSGARPAVHLPDTELMPPSDDLRLPTNVGTAGSRKPLIFIVIALVAAGGFAAWWFLGRTPGGPADPVAVEIGAEDPAHAVAPVVRLVAANRLDDAVLSMQRALENSADRKKLIAHARTVPELEKVLADPSLQALLKE
jgi:hypothetical protein